MKNRKCPAPTVSLAARLLILIAAASLGSCSFIENEFIHLDRLPPSFAAGAPDAPAPVVARP